MPKSFKKIGLIARRPGEMVALTLSELYQFLQGRGVEPVVESNTAQLLSLDYSHVPEQELGRHCDLLVVVGGDGSMLNASHVAVDQSLPVLGVNRGKLGFLTDIHPESLELKVGQVLDGHYFEEERFLLDVSAHRHGELAFHHLALNDMVMSPGQDLHLIRFEIMIQDQFMCRERADGLIVATPTGSTAYALSGGGPILHPTLDAMVLVPMFPHTLGSRPVVVSGSGSVKIKIAADNQTLPRINCDGLSQYQLDLGDVIEVTKHPERLRLIHPNDYNYYETLRTKLGWGSRVLE